MTENKSTHEPILINRFMRANALAQAAIAVHSGEIVVADVPVTRGQARSRRAHTRDLFEISKMLLESGALKIQPQHTE